ncbi:hypothetical protein BwiPL1_56170 (plasmid) [Bacillus wiedmannii]|nr:hypothetical protein BwiPL1_56170 [Bacillus wiedmannii]
MVDYYQIFLITMTGSDLFFIYNMLVTNKKKQMDILCCSIFLFKLFIS